MKENARFWHHHDAGPVDFLHATYYTHSFPKHIHEGYVFGVVTRGVEAFDREGEDFQAEEGSLVIINPGDTHTGYAPFDMGWSYRTLYPQTDLIRKVAGMESSHAGLYPGFSRAVVKDSALVQDFLYMHRIHEFSDSALERETLFYSVMRRLISLYSDTRISLSGRQGKDASLVSRVCDYLSAHYDENPGLVELSDLTGVSPWHLTRVFRTAKGIPPHTWLNQYRVNRARDMILQGASPSMAASASGFTDQSHLNKHFKRYFGVTPGKISRPSNNVQDQNGQES